MNAKANLKGHVLSRPTQRGVTIEAAAAYLGMSVDTYKRHQAAGKLPGPWPGTKRYDLHAIDRAVDRWSGLAEEAEPKGKAGARHKDWAAKL